MPEPTATAEPVREQLRGVRAIGAALDAGRPLQQLWVCGTARSEEERALIERAEAQGIAVRWAKPREYARLAECPDSQEPIALVGEAPGASLAEALARGGAVWLLVGTAYPGNAGFVIRTAEVSGASAVVIDANFDRSERRDALRAGLRAERVFPVLFAGASEVLKAAREARFRCIAIEDVGSAAPWEADLRGPILFVLGGEREGIPDDLLAQCDGAIRIPMRGFIPSYNLQAAMAAVAAERLRQLSS